MVYFDFTGTLKCLLNVLCRIRYFPPTVLLIPNSDLDYTRLTLATTSFYIFLNYIQKQAAHARILPGFSTTTRVESLSNTVPCFEFDSLWSLGGERFGKEVIPPRTFIIRHRTWRKAPRDFQVTQHADLPL